MEMDEENELQPNGLWPAPVILSPGSNSTVSPGGFNIVALSSGGLTTSWKIECWGEATDHHGSEGEWMKLEHWVPDTSFDRFGARFNFKVRYKQAWVWSDWAECHNLYVPKPEPPEPDKPKSPHIYSPPYPASVRQELIIYNVSGHASVLVSTERGEPVPGYYISNTGGFIPAAEWVVGVTRVKAVQTVGGVASDPSNVVSIAVKPSTPTITPPPDPAAAKQALTITGVMTGDVTLQVSTDKNAPVIGDFTGSGATRTFTPKANWAAGITRVKVVQTVSGVASEPSSLVSVTVKPSTPTITPPPDPAAAKQALTITGVMTGDVTLQVSTDKNAPVIGDFTGSGATRTFTPKANWAAGITRVKVVQTVGGVASDPSALVFIAVKPSSPVITPPPNPTSVNQALTITNVMTESADLQMFTEAGAPVGGNFTGSNATRTFLPAVSWRVGTTRVKVVQTVDYVDSDPSELVTIVAETGIPGINPPPDPAHPKQALTITGVLSGTVTLQIHTNENVLVEGEFTGEGNTRTFTPRDFWPIAFNYVKAVQTLDGVPFDPSDLAMIVVRPSTLAIIRPSNPVTEKQALIIANYSVGSSLRMRTEANASVDGSVTNNGGILTFTPTNAWAPGVTKVKAVQLYNSVESIPSDLVSVIARPSILVIEQPTIPAASNQQLKITGVVSNVDTLQMSSETGAAIDGEYTGSGALRTFIPKANWAAGKTPVKAMQIVSDVASEWSDVVTVAVMPPKPDISQPTDPAADKEPLTINGVLANASHFQMTTGSGAIVDGSFRGSGTTRTFTPEANWPAGITQVQVAQIIDDVPSAPSELVTIRILAKPPKPRLTQPLPNSSHLANLAVEGTCEAGATVAVQYANDIALEGKMSYVQTQWSFEHPWEPGQQRIKAVQTSGGQTSDPTDMLDFYIRPPLAVIEQPDTPVAVRGGLKISNVWSGVVALRMSTQTGVGVDGEFAGDGATRTFIPDADWTPGENTVYVIQTVNGVDSDPSDTCTFTVEVADRPDPPGFQQPQRGGGTSRYPTIQVVGLPGALHTVRLVGGDTLCEDTADDDGILEFTVVDPLVPGYNELQGKQASNGLDSDWSKPHPFTVHAPPATPVIRVPGADGNALRRPRIQGGGETGGQIVLRHVAEPEPPFAFADGSKNWRWNAEEEWDIGTYTIQAQQTADGDCSEWTQPHRFQVVESLYGIGDAIPVLATPVVGTGQSVVLRVQVISADTGMAAEGVKVQWRLNGELEPLTETTTDFEGWTQYAYTPDTIGKREILADITQANEGVAMTEPYEVNAVLQDEWAKEAELCLDGQRIDLAVSDLVLARGKVEAYKLELKVSQGSALLGSTVTMQNLWSATERGLTFVPDLETPQVIEEGLSVHWYIFAEEASGGIFGLNLNSSVLPAWQLPGRVEAHITEMVNVAFDSFAQVFGGGPAYPCLGATHTVTVKPRQAGPLIGQHVTLELSDGAAELGVIVSPTTPQILGTEGVSWTLNCVDSHKNGDFAVWLKVPAWNSESAALPMVLGHNKVKITEKYGPTDEAGGWGRYGIRATSTFTELPAGGVSVTIQFPHGQPTLRETGQDGWLYVRYDGDIPTLSIFNHYDGSNVMP
ncbi:hypothetical protein H8F23_21055 [Pseudomonas sp. P155]|uniref:Uncharacterized protein n=1 Tax=Pseudomonas neuropathica TaxID=2730425 RepID=A0ABS0BPR1_9PSED|nr:hypothetical protein [Pseudomonas neuropathica]MBF6035743.1 hypothetical protein [Pseudomonas neuropathica]